MNNNLSSREALKKQIKNDYCKNLCPLPYAEYYCPSNCSARYFIELIDNAPSVEAFTKEDMAGAYNEGYACGSRENARPQGEWIEVDIKPMPYGGYTCNRKCNKCGYFTKEYRLNFCPNCGAKMQKGGTV